MVLCGSPKPWIKTLGNPRPYACTGVNAGPVQPLIRLLQDCWPKLKSAGKFRSNLAAPLTQLTSPPNLIECGPLAKLILSRNCVRFSVRSTGENGLEPIKPVPAI